jgi:hypothetical protein
LSVEEIDLETHDLYVFIEMTESEYSESNEWKKKMVWFLLLNLKLWLNKMIFLNRNFCLNSRLIQLKDLYIKPDNLKKALISQTTGIRITITGNC